MPVHSSASSTLPTISAQKRAELETALAEAAAGRERQLVELPPTPGDLVAAAHRDSVARILAEIHKAQARLAHGEYGRCVGCRAAIPLARLELRPWTTLCVGCAHHGQS